MSKMKKTGMYPPLKPVKSAPSQDSIAGQARIPVKRHPVAVACESCRIKKSKCSGHKPTCTACQTRDIQCQYDFKESVFSMRTIARDLRKELDEHQRLIVHLHTLTTKEDMDAAIGGFYAAMESRKHQWKQSVLTPAVPDHPDAGGPSSAVEEEEEEEEEEEGGEEMEEESGMEGRDGVPEGCMEIYGNKATLASLCIPPEPTGAPAKVALPVFLLQPLWRADVSLPCSMFVNYRKKARWMLANNTPEADILGPEAFNTELFFRNRVPSDRFLVDSWACELTKPFHGIDVPTRFALAFLLSRRMKWVIVPTEESWKRVPEIIRPTPSQRLIAHFPSIDMAVSPLLREKLCRNQLYWTASQSITLYWPYLTEHCFNCDPVTGATSTLSPRFEEHACDMNNWMYGEEIIANFPDLAGKFNSPLPLPDDYGNA